MWGRMKQFADIFFEWLEAAWSWLEMNGLYVLFYVFFILLGIMIVCVFGLIWRKKRKQPRAMLGQGKTIELVRMAQEQRRQESELQERE